MQRKGVHSTIFMIKLESSQNTSTLFHQDPPTSFLAWIVLHSNHMQSNKRLCCWPGCRTLCIPSPPHVCKPVCVFSSEQIQWGPSRGAESGRPSKGPSTVELIIACTILTLTSYMGQIIPEILRYHTVSLTHTHGFKKDMSEVNKACVGALIK